MGGIYSKNQAVDVDVKQEVPKEAPKEVLKPVKREEDLTKYFSGVNFVLQLNKHSDCVLRLFIQSNDDVRYSKDLYVVNNIYLSDPDDDFKEIDDYYFTLIGDDGIKKIHYEKRPSDYYKRILYYSEKHELLIDWFKHIDGEIYVTIFHTIPNKPCKIYKSVLPFGIKS